MMNTTDRYFAPGLKQAMDTQGRHMRWLAKQVGVDAPLLTHASRSRRTINGDTARLISSLIGVPFNMLFVSPDGDTGDAKEVAA